MRKVDGDRRAGKTSGLEGRRGRNELMRVRVIGVLVVLWMLRLGIEGRYGSGGSRLWRRRDWLCVVNGEGSEVLVASSRHDSAATLDLRLLHARGAVDTVELVVETCRWESDLIKIR